MRYCDGCGKQVSDEAVFCRECGAKLAGSISEDKVNASVESMIGKNCPYCQTPIKPGAEVLVCIKCGIAHHTDCWKANGNKCTTFGCDGIKEITISGTDRSSIIAPNGNPVSPPAVIANPGRSAHKWKKIIAAAIIVLGLVGGGVYAKYNTTATMVLPDGTKYTGEIRWGKITGNGTMVYSNGRTYKGQFIDSVSQGAGNMVLADGTRYEGDVVDGKRHGNGKYYDARQQLVYEGSWFNDERNGQGLQLMSDGSRYVGMYVSNKREGEGKLQSKSGQAIYDGTWQNDEMHGIGKMWIADGWRYDGQIKTGKRHGQGKLFNSSGKLIYEGEWADDLKHGQGTMIADDGSVLRGSWNNGAYVPPQVARAPEATSRPDNGNNKPAPTQKRQTPPQKRGDPTPQEVFGAFINIINQFERK